MSDLRPNAFTLLGLLLALCTLTFFILAIVGSTTNNSTLQNFGVPSVFTLLGGALFLWIGANDQVSAQKR